MEELAEVQMGARLQCRLPQTEMDEYPDYAPLVRRQRTGRQQAVRITDRAFNRRSVWDKVI